MMVTLKKSLKGEKLLKYTEKWKFMSKNPTKIFLIPLPISHRYFDTPPVNKKYPPKRHPSTVLGAPTNPTPGGNYIGDYMEAKFL